MCWIGKNIPLRLIFSGSASGESDHAKLLTVNYPWGISVDTNGRSLGMQQMNMKVG